MCEPFGQGGGVSRDGTKMGSAAPASKVATDGRLMCAI